MKLAWATDVHMNFLDPFARAAFFDEVNALQPEWLVLSGDIGEARSIASLLDEIERSVRARTAFVLGNHDYYGGDLATVRQEMGARTDPAGRTVYLHGLETPLGVGTAAMVGVDGWGDGRYGTPLTSQVLLNDWREIREFADRHAMLDVDERLEILASLGDESAARLRSRLEAALASFAIVWVVTHVPPFVEAAWHDGKPSAPDWAPWFACKATGDVLLAAARAHPRREIVVLCGHTHGVGEYEPAPNLRVLTGRAEYGRTFVRVFTL